MTLKSLLHLRSDEAGAYDGSVTALAVKPFRNVRSMDSEGRFRIDSGFIEVGRNPELDSLGSFTLEANLTPDKIDVGRQNIMEAKTPAVAFFIEAGGVLVGGIHTAAGWKSVTSGSVRLQARVKSHVRFTRDERGRMALEINGRPVGAASVPEAIVPVGPTGFRIGTWTDGRGYQFVGEIADVQIRSGAAPAALWTQKAQTAKRLETRFKALFELGAVTVELNPDASYARLQPIKDIMNAAGVAKISDLSTLRITRRTVMTPGKVMVAARKQQAAADVNWGKVAQSIVLANPQEKRAMLARYMTNRNSTKVLSGLKVAPAPAGAAAAPPPPAGVIGSGGRIPSLGDAGRTSTRLPVEVMRVSPTLRLAEKPKPTADFVRVEGNQLKLADAAAISRLELKQPGNWPALSAMTPQLMSLKTIPVNSAVMIAGILDLTNTELVVEPAVETFYIIAEKIVCGANAKITWRRPGGSTPPRADDPGLNGRGYAGVHTKRDSRDGLDAEDGRGGGTGINGAGGIHAPHLEVWVKDLSGMPNLDLNGEDGIKGGRGQRGGRGGNGADGHVGKRAWVFKWICTKRPGDGGSGGDGGDGGRGGRGGNGGDGGNITIGVLDGTLESAVTSRAFKIKNQGGQKGRGGDGGEGGRGGRGGRSGRGETCKDAKDGANGAAGQRGRPGPDGASMGDDGEVQFFEFSQQAWEELLTRPWISELSPERIFPGDRLTIRGSRFSSRDRVMVGALSLVPGINADESISVAIPPNIAGGLHVVYILRSDGTQSNRLRLRVRPRLDAFTSPLTPGSDIVLSGSAFLNGAAVLVAGQAVPADVQSPSRLSFKMPDTGGSGSAGGRVALQVNNPDGMVSNSREGTIPQILELPFTFGVHNLSFGNFTDGVPDWGTYEDTFGAAEIWHELLDPIFGHPILTSAFYGFYHYFLKGEARGGLATGFCTSLASLVADKFWLGETDTHGITKASVHKMLTAIHGRLLSRESLIHFHDQSREGVSRVEKTYREI
ncbi:MAG TPA: IPT/TIG domain-containing protein, partial [Desulfobacterales bacterium]|nr:IPT/TIG domain-containing protein [Desulfobacterales bacterium]